MEQDSAPTPHQSEALGSPPHRRSSLVLIVSIILTALIAGIAVYTFEKRRENLVIQDLQSKVARLESSLAASPTPTVTAATTASCQDTLQASLSNGSGTAGTYYYQLTVTNTGSTDCTISSYPPVPKALDATGNVVGTAINSFDPNPLNPQGFTIVPGGKVYAQLGFPDSENYAGGVCKSMKTLQLDISSATIHLTIPNIDTYQPGFTDMLCDNTLRASGFSATPL